MIDLGRQPLANAYPDADSLATEEATFPLAVVCCGSCSLVQLAETVDPAQLFGDYRYLSSASDGFVAHVGELAAELIVRLGLSDESCVVEIGSNDGYLLQHYRAAGVPVLGIEPAMGVAQRAALRGIRTVAEFFSADLARDLRLEGVTADVIHANNVLAHVPDIHDVLAGIELLLAPGGQLVLETPYVADLVAGLEFDTIYHEHVFYYSLSSLVALLRLHELAVVDVERVTTHGGSLRVYAIRDAGAGVHVMDRVAILMAEERTSGLLDPAFYRSFASRVEALGRRLHEVLAGLKASGQRIAAYGAAAKGTVLLNAFAIGADLIDFVVDRNPLKQGRFMPGVHIPIRPTEALLEEQPDTVLLLAWNIADEVLRQQHAYLDAGGRFLVPVPEPRFRP